MAAAWDRLSGKPRWMPSSGRPASTSRRIGRPNGPRRGSVTAPVVATSRSHSATLRRPLTVTSRGDSTTVVTAGGELDLASASELTDALAEHQPRARHWLLVDLSEVTFLDCAGLSPFVAASQNWKRAGGRLVITAASPQAAHVLELLEGVLPAGLVPRRPAN